MTDVRHVLSRSGNAEPARPYYGQRSRLGRITGRALLSLTALTTVGTALSAHEVAAAPRVTLVTPDPVVQGATITVRGLCNPPGGRTLLRGNVTVRSDDGADVIYTEVALSVDGSFQSGIPIPSTATVGRWRTQVQCEYVGDHMESSTLAPSFYVTAPAPPPATTTTVPPGPPPTFKPEEPQS